MRKPIRLNFKGFVGTNSALVWQVSKALDNIATTTTNPVVIVLTDKPVPELVEAGFYNEVEKPTATSTVLSNMTLEELLKYGNIPEDTLVLLIPAIEELRDSTTFAEQETLEYEVEQKILKEQLDWARTTLLAILNKTKLLYRYKETKEVLKSIQLAIEESKVEL